jgi:hypothetical protein
LITEYLVFDIETYKNEQGLYTKETTMKSTRVIIGFLLAFCVFLAIKCSSPAKTTVNSSQAQNAIVGILYNSSSNTPAKGVRVHIRPKKSLADTAGFGIYKRSAIMTATDSVVTDSSGRYAFDTTLDTGMYVIEGASGDNAVFIDSVAVKGKAHCDTLPPDTLKPTGALEGIVKLFEGGDPRKVFVLAFGINKFAQVDTNGRFTFSGLAEAKYDLRLISLLYNYGVFDLDGVQVRSGVTTSIDTINLNSLNGFGMPLINAKIGQKAFYTKFVGNPNDSAYRDNSHDTISLEVINIKNDTSILKETHLNTIEPARICTLYYQDSIVYCKNGSYIFNYPMLEFNGKDTISEDTLWKSYLPFYYRYNFPLKNCKLHNENIENQFAEINIDGMLVDGPGYGMEYTKEKGIIRSWTYHSWGGGIDGYQLISGK